MIAALASVVFALTSPAFLNSALIPKRLTCDGAGVSPPLRSASEFRPARCVPSSHV
jgi:phosphatidylethanolamine-binding protein (PEBP) family uncharacterized protein